MEFEDGVLCNVELQKIGYLFPGQRSETESASEIYFLETLAFSISILYY